MKEKITDFILINLGIFLVAVGVYFFKFPNNFSTGGVSGLSVIFGHLFKSITPGTFVIIINGVFLILGFIFLDKGFGLKTVYSSVMFSLLIRVFEIAVPLSNPITDNKMLELVYSVIFPGAGSAILFNCNSSTGGTDIVAMIMKKYTRLDIGKALLCTDFLISVSTIFVFNMETGLFSILGLALKSLVVDSVIESINLRKSFTVITTKPKEVCEFINYELHRGATIWEGKGAFTDEKKWVILTALRRYEANELKKYVKTVDPKGFLLITNTSEIIGKGFRQL